MTKASPVEIVADLRTAQNRMFQFVIDQMEKYKQDGTVELLKNDKDRAKQLYEQVQEQLFSLLQINSAETSQWHMGIVDSGKRAIEALVSYFCLAEPEANIAVNTENYVAFNKFSAVTALKTQKDVEFSTPFNLKMGQALTIGSPKEMDRAKTIINNNKTKTLWIAWNSTSTGTAEKVEELVAYRNSCGSNTLIISDAASLPLFTKNWQSIAASCLPDVFFFSLRKQGLPYDGPQDEVNQAKNSGAIYLFNQRAMERSILVNGPNLYDTPRPAEAAEFSITQSNQRANHLKHLLKLKCCLNELLGDSSKHLEQQDQVRKQIKDDISKVFGLDGQLRAKGYRLVADSKAQSETAYIVSVPSSVKPKELIAKLKSCGVEVSLSMHPELPGNSHFRFACYPATTLDEAQIALNSFRQCMS